jgi:tetratricopeptide (TPR) repeat protein
MFKFILLFIIIIIAYIGSINQIFSNDKIKKSSIGQKIIQRENKNDFTKEEDNLIHSLKTKVKVHKNKQNILEKQINYLFKEADNFMLKDEYQKAIDAYDKIINKLKNSKNNKLLEKFAKAHLLKAYIYRNYLENIDNAIAEYDIIIDEFKDTKNIALLKLYYNAQTLKAYLLDKDEAIEIYDEIINKFANSTNKELIKKFISAQYSKTYLSNSQEKLNIYDEIIKKLQNTKDKDLLKDLANVEFTKAKLLNDSFNNISDATDVYDEIISQFENYDDNEFKQIVADALFDKSYILMRDDKEESMEILDEIIDKYKNTQVVSLKKNLEYSIINNIELALITDNDDTNYRELANKYLLPEQTSPELDMLKILRDAKDCNQDEAFKEWKNRYKNYQFEDWSFENLKRWSNSIEDKDVKKRVKRYLNEFIKHDINYQSN